MGRHIKNKKSSDLDLATYLNQSGEIDRDSYAALLSELRSRLLAPSLEPVSIAFDSKLLAVVGALRNDLRHVVALRKRAIQDAGHGRYEGIPKVPSFADSILRYVCSPKSAEAVLGDLEEQFRARAAKRGLRAAKRWYYWQVLRSLLVFGLQLLQYVAEIRELLEKIRW